MEIRVASDADAQTIAAFYKRNGFIEVGARMNPRFAHFRGGLPEAMKRLRPDRTSIICQAADRIRKPSVKKISER